MAVANFIVNLNKRLYSCADYKFTDTFSAKQTQGQSLFMFKGLTLYNTT